MPWQSCDWRGQRVGARWAGVAGLRARQIEDTDRRAADPITSRRGRSASNSRRSPTLAAAAAVTTRLLRARSCSPTTSAIRPSWLTRPPARTSSPGRFELGPRALAPSPNTTPPDRFDPAGQRITRLDETPGIKGLLSGTRFTTPAPGTGWMGFRPRRPPGTRFPRLLIGAGGLRTAPGCPSRGRGGLLPAPITSSQDSDDHADRCVSVRCQARRAPRGRRRPVHEPEISAFATFVVTDSSTRPYRAPSGSAAGRASTRRRWEMPTIFIGSLAQIRGT